MQPNPQPAVSNLDFPYRRFSNEVYAATLSELLDAHGIPYAIMNEPEGAGSVFLGSSVVPGVIVMVSESDARRIKELEKELTPQLHAEKPDQQTEEPVESYWILLGYLFALLGAPIAIIAGLHLFSAKRRNPDFTSSYAYDKSARTQGKYIFFFAFAILIFSFVKLFTGARMTFLDTISFVIWQLHHAL